MSAFHGPQGKGARRVRKLEKRKEAEARQKKALFAVHPNGKCTCRRGERIHSTSISKVGEKLLQEIFAG